MQLLGQLELHPSQDHRPGHGEQHDPDHEPALPHGVPEQVEGADRWMLGGDQPQRGVHHQHGTHHQQRHGGHQVTHTHSPVVPVGAVGRGRPVDHADGHQERQGRDEREQVLDPGGPHGLGAAHHDPHRGDGHSHHAQGHPFEHDRLLHHPLHVRGKLRGTEPPPARGR